MTPEEIADLLAKIAGVADALKSHVDKSCADMSARFDAAMGEIAKKRDEAGERSGENEDDLGERGMAKRVAADSSSDIQVTNSALASLARKMSTLETKMSRPMSDLNAFADSQARADAVMASLGQRATPPLAGEDLIDYEIRLARPMQKYSKTWKDVSLALIAPDRKAFNNALDGIRADALRAGMNADDLEPGQHRKITKTMPGGHQVTEWVGQGTFVKAMSRPIRHVKSIGVIHHQARAR